MRSFVGIDYSINKPAITLYFKGFFHFFFFPLSLKKKDIQAYANIKDVTCINRDLGIVDTTKLSESSLAKEHTKRSIELSNLILDTLDQHLFSDKDFEPSDCWLSSEGLAFSSSGDAALNLASNKGVFLGKLYEHINITNIFTYSPISIKSIAGCAKKECIKDKTCMIKAFCAEEFINDSDFKNKVADGTLTKTKNYYPGIDDIVDSYWCLKTMYLKEKLLGIPEFD